MIWCRAKAVIRRPDVEVVPETKRAQFLEQLEALDDDQRLKLVVQKWGFVVKHTDRKYEWMSFLFVSDFMLMILNFQINTCCLVVATAAPMENGSSLPTETSSGQTVDG